MALTLVAIVGLTGAGLKTNNQIGGVRVGAENGYDYSVTFTPNNCTVLGNYCYAGPSRDELYINGLKCNESN